MNHGPAYPVMPLRTFLWPHKNVPFSIALSSTAGLLPRLRSGCTILIKAFQHKGPRLAFSAVVNDILMLVLVGKKKKTRQTT